MKKRVLSFVLAIMTALTFTAVLPSDVLNFNVAAASTVNYNGNSFAVYSRTKEQIGAQYGKALAAGDSYFYDGEYYAVQPSNKSPYHQGVLSGDTLAAMQEMTNYVRYIYGAKPLLTDCVPTERLQYECLDRNFVFSHWVSDSDKPDDMPQELWDKGASCTHNILAWGYSPHGAVVGWLNEGYSISSGSWDTLGHRYALLSPTLSEIQFGYCCGIAIGDCVSYDNTSNDNAFYAFPSPGYMPNNIISTRSSAWNIDLNNSKLTVPDTADVKITIKNLGTGSVYVRSEADNTAQVSSSSIVFAQPADAANINTYTDSYKVTVTGLKDAATGNPATITYVVNFFDVSPYTPSSVVSATADGFSELTLYKTMDNEESLKKAAAVLPNSVSVKSLSGNTCTVPVKGHWTLDMKNHCWYNSADVSALPKTIDDKFNMLSRVEISYTISDDVYDSYNSLYISPNTMTDSESGYMSVYRTLVTYQHSRIFRIIKNNDGTYSGVTVFDKNTSSAFDKEQSQSASDYYKTDGLTGDDSGEYISIYFSDEPYWTDAKVCTAIKILTITHDFGSWDVTKAPTADAEGILTRKCIGCGKTETKKAPMLALNGWSKSGETWYYLENGKKAVGWREIKSVWYYFDSNGAMATGWREVSGKWYYLDSNGKMATGWRLISGKWYYLKPSGAMMIGWAQIEGKWYYFAKSGAMQTHWTLVNNKWYYLGKSGDMQTGWLLHGGTWYYLSSSGAMQTGWQKINGSWYYFNSSGAMQTGWLTLSGKRYYLDGNGKMVTGTKYINGKRYTFDSSGVMK